jgi:hypothetical protein
MAIFQDQSVEVRVQVFKNLDDKYRGYSSDESRQNDNEFEQMKLRIEQLELKLKQTEDRLDHVEDRLEQLEHGSKKKVVENKAMNKALLDNIKNGNLTACKILIANGADKYFGKSCGVRRSAEYGHLETVKYFVSLYISIYLYNDYAIKNAMKNGHWHVVNYLLQLDNDTKNNYLVQYNVTTGRCNILRYLIKDCVNIDIESLSNVVHMF